MASSEEQQQRKKEEEEETSTSSTSTSTSTKKKKEEHEHKTKLIEFLGRTTPIVLQNQNGPCPLLAICNVLLLKNSLNLSNVDADHVSQERLLSLVADRLIDSNSNSFSPDKDSAYLNNLQHNIADAIDLLPRLATGIDVNIKFRRIDDFEFTRECAIFDLLDIPLYHGWIVDPQDHDTANAIGSKSYNTLMGDLVALETQNMEQVPSRNSLGDDTSVDFVAATTATLGVPSPHFPGVVSFEESSPYSVSDHQKLRKGDMEEEEKLFIAMKLSEGDIPTSSDAYLAIDTNVESTHVRSSESTPLDSIVTLHEHGSSAGDQNLDKPEQTFSENLNSSSIEDNVSSKIVPAEVVSTSPKTDEGLGVNQLSRNDSEFCLQSIDVTNTLGERVNEPSPFDARETIFVVENQATGPGGNESQLDYQSNSSSDINDPIDINRAAAVPSVPPSETAAVSSSSINHREPDVVFTSSVDGSEPMYEGEECILDSSAPVYEDQEPMYEGEGVLAKQADKGIPDASNVRSSKDELTPYMGQLIKDFLKSNASQLTINGLFCLQDGLKERELCVFFRNNHFSTMFKFEGQLYLLATDQGYINQPDLVWEKLNEVNGNTVFMTGNFKEFKLENQTTDKWNEESAMTSTADYLATLDRSVDTGSNFNSDLQLAMALQQQEFDEQTRQQNTPPPRSTSGSSRLVTGPQVPRGRPVPVPPAKQDAKSKEKCIVM